MLFYMGRHKPIPGGLAAAVQAADTHVKQHGTPPSLQCFKLSFIGNQKKITDRTKWYEMLIQVIMELRFFMAAVFGYISLVWERDVVI